MIKEDKKNRRNKAKEFLLSAVDLAVYIESLQARLHQLETRAKNKGMSMENVKLGTRVSSKLYNADNLYCAIIIVKDSISQNLILFEEKYKKVHKVLSMFDDIKMQMIMEYRYLQGMPWAQIAEKTGYSERSLYRIHNKALDLTADILDNMEQ